jgi:hypothetical protein
MFCDLKTLTFEELAGQQRAAEDTDKAGCLILAEEDWLAKHKHCFQSSLSKEGSSAVGGGGQNKNKEPSSDASRSNGSGGVKLTSEGTPQRKGWCRNGGIYGH